MPYKITFTETIPPELEGSLWWTTSSITPERQAIFEQHVASGNIISSTATLDQNDPLKRYCEIVYKDLATREFIMQQGQQLPNSGLTNGFILTDLVGTEI